MPSDEGIAPKVFAYTGGMLLPGRVKRILTLAGMPPQLGKPSKDDLVAVWGRSPLAARGEAMAAAAGAGILRVEDAFVRSLRPGRAGDATLGLLIDRTGVHFDASAPSDLETLLARDPLDDHVLLTRARDGIARLRAADLSKYNVHDPALPAPSPGYVLVVDQLQGDASVIHGGANAQTFREMLVRAQEDHPGHKIVIKTHPESQLGLRSGHYGPGDVSELVSLLSDPVSPHTLLEGAVAIYTATSQLGFEAILAGHRPRVFGQPFYAGWGLSEDEAVFSRRRRKLTKVQLFAAAMILAPTWYDPCRDRLCSFEEALDQIEAEVRAWREDRHGYVALGMRRWKRGALNRLYGGARRMRFTESASRAASISAKTGREVMAWSGRVPEGLSEPFRRVEDGFLRSRGLGAELVPPLSLVSDDLGIYYDPSRENRLDRMIAAGPPPGGEARGEMLIARINALRLSKYNVGTAAPALPEGHRILVPGQVEDDASIVLGTSDVRTNLALLERVRAENPDAIVLYKPHPDVEAGLRPGAVAEAEVLRHADMILPHTDPAALLGQVAEVWTMTSLLGFEALLRGVTVTCVGAPFYAGWGLTRDLAPVPAWRNRRVTLEALAHAALIAYPRYVDPVTGRPCPPEVIVDRLAEGPDMHRPGGNQLLSFLQSALSQHSRLWRRR
ncbi:MAG: beta-3-deoxy-D-manno-oct-2-ulosonic acid transferase [Cereibacter sphaeroides]|uniref:Beta-3-deoxy-D-manno-oct-2-ulosonic acid transferase n=1 Tax=Cereibacter sphaeroides TaxID=1063 RepID=A0A2W5S7Y6_CERSP|nr:MAG: beta-3-deoxy-D-manno-oct-2-ulosonic acid transferase [Cereibacter sphaeroides]